MSEARRKRRSENYNILRAVGFTAVEATRLKDLSRKSIKEICDKMDQIKNTRKNWEEEEKRLKKEIFENCEKNHNQ